VSVDLQIAGVERTRLTGSRHSAAATTSPPRLCAVLIGFTAIVAQVVLLRELMVVFNGNEISLGIMFASWLLWTALGSSTLGRFPRQAVQARRATAALQVTAAMLLPAIFLLVRSTRLLFKAVPGELLGPVPMLIASFVSLSAFCAVSGWLFATASRMYAVQGHLAPELATSSVYLLEAVGSGIGGVVVSILFVLHASALQIAVLVGILNLLSAVNLSLTGTLQRALMGVALLVGIFTWPAANRLETWSEAGLWPGFRLLATRTSIYGKLAVIASEGNRSLSENGLLSFTVPDPAAAEEAVHFALLEHPAPKHVLLIGSGINGAIEQAMLHPTLERLDYVELDPMVFDLADKYFSRQWERIHGNERVRIHAMDGRLLLKTTREEFDVIIINLPDPQTAQLNRFYTREFFREAAARLNRRGILSLQVRGAENYISPELAEFLGCIRRTLLEIFPDVTSIPGDTVHFFAATEPGTLTQDVEIILKRLRDRQIQPVYVREYYLPFRMMPERIHDLELQIQTTSSTALNRDLAPAVYYFDTVLWGAQFSERYRDWFHSVARIPFLLVAAIGSGILLLLSAFLFHPSRPNFPGVAGLSVSITGLTLMTLQVLLLLGFQAVYGYVYHQTAVLIAAFMAGMGLGAWRGRRKLRERGSAAQPNLRRLAALQIGVAVCPLILLLVLGYGLGTTGSAGAAIGAKLLFPGRREVCAAHLV
jgi:spermidine synthase